MADRSKPWYRRTLKRLESFRDVPMTRLWALLVAVFLLFSVNGFYLDLRNYGVVPYAIVLMVAIYSGLNAVLWVLVPARLPSIVYLPLTALQFFNGRLTTAIADWMRDSFHLHPAASTDGIRLSANAMLVNTIAAYIFLVVYIRREEKLTLRVKSQLELAHGIQKTLVPTLTLQTARFEVYGISEPSERVGGDLVDALLLDRGDLVAYLADIAGHGLPAGILMGMLKTAARTALLDLGDRPPQLALPLLLDRLNIILPQVKEPHMYATFTGLRLGAEGEVFYAMAASPPLLHWRAREDVLSQIQEPQLPLGLLPHSDFVGYQLEVASGDLLAIVTDGILEVAAADGEEFGCNRLEAVLASVSAAPLPQIARAVLAAARTYGRQLDDQTLLLVRCL